MTPRTILPLLLASAALAAGTGLTGLVTHGSEWTTFAQCLVGPPMPTTILAMPSLEGYGVVITWSAPDHPDITGFTIERYRLVVDGVWEHSHTIQIEDRTARTHLDLCGMGRFAYRVQSVKTE